MVRWLDQKEKDMMSMGGYGHGHGHGSGHNKGNQNKISSDVKLKKCLRNELNCVLKKEENKGMGRLFGEEQRHKILESSYKKVLKAYKQINEKQSNECE
eukprot:UN07228